MQLEINNTVWLVDDEKELGEAFKDQFNDEFIVDYFDSAESALADFHNKLHPSVIVVDLKMPGMDGLEMMKIMRKQGYIGEFVLISGFAARSHLAEAFQLNVFSFLDKPFKMDALKKTIQLGTNKSIENLKTIISVLETKISLMGQLANSYHERLTDAENFIFEKIPNFSRAPEQNQKHMTLLAQERELMKRISMLSKQLQKL